MPMAERSPLPGERGATNPTTSCMTTPPNWLECIPMASRVSSWMRPAGFQ
jgi:hypothetical protein